MRCSVRYREPAPTTFSKIQGRFRTRLSLSSANVDEVIQERLLAKRDEVRADLEAEYARQGRHSQKSTVLQGCRNDLPAVQECG